MARTWFRWPGRTSALLLVVSVLTPALAREVRPRFPMLPGHSSADTGLTAFDLRPTYKLRGYTPADHFSSPEGIAVDERNRILYVADTGKGRLVGFSLQGLPKFVLKLEGISAPRDLVVDEKGRVFVADKEAPVVRAVDAQGKTLLKIDLGGASTAGSPRIRGLAVDPQGRLYVGDQAGAQVLICDTEGHVLSRIGSPGNHPGQLKMIEDVAVDRVGRIYVIDSVGMAVNVFDPRGKFVFRFGRISADEDDFRSPVAIATDRHDQLWVVDEDAHSVKVFDGRGFALRRFGGDSPVAVASFLFPSAVATDALGNVYTAEKGAGQVQVFTLGNPFAPFRP